MSEVESELSLELPAIVLGRRSLDSPYGLFEVTFFRDHSEDRTAMAITRGDLASPLPLLARVHSSCATSECLMACDCDCAEQLDRALLAISEVGRGVVFYLIQEGRGAGLTAKARDRMIVQASGHRLTTFDAYAEMGLPPDLRRYDCIAPMARALGIQGPLNLLTNNPEKQERVAAALVAEKIDVRSTIAIEGTTSAFNLDYLRAKRQSGHVLSRNSEQAAILPPEPVEVEPLRRGVEHPYLLSTACYLLPVDLGLGSMRGRRISDSSHARDRVDWFRMRVVYDLRTARESVLLSMGLSSALRAEGAALTMRLVDRLPCFQSTRRGRLRDELIAIRSHGEGCIVVHFDDFSPNLGAIHDALDATSLDATAHLSREILSVEWARMDPERDEPDADR